MREYSFTPPMDRWHRTARTWFDGSVESVDRRLADCRQLLAASEAALGRQWGQKAAQAHLDRIAELQATQRVLEGQRDSLLTAGNDRKVQARPRQTGKISEQDRRYVELEAAKFVATNPGVDRDELITRARHKASVETSTFSRRRSADVVSAFCSRVANLYRPPARRRTAAASAPDVADEMMFI